ncbi:hypothetical protein MGI18_26940 [Bacillus sp. OVS6]|nr:hypothetical protein MGI18_26940 [Bacillus sp. OVS6]
MSEVKADVSNLKTDMSEVKADVSNLKTDMSEVKTDVSSLKTEMSGMRAELLKEMAIIEGKIDDNEVKSEKETTCCLKKWPH